MTQAAVVIASEKSRFMLSEMSKCVVEINSKLEELLITFFRVQFK